MHHSGVVGDESAAGRVPAPDGRHRCGGGALYGHAGAVSVRHIAVRLPDIIIISTQLHRENLTWVEEVEEEEEALEWDGGDDVVLVEEGEVEVEQGDGVWEVERDTPGDGGAEAEAWGGDGGGDHGHDISGGEEGEVVEVADHRRNNHNHRSQMEIEHLSSQSYCFLLLILSEVVR